MEWLKLWILRLFDRIPNKWAYSDKEVDEKSKEIARRVQGDGKKG